MQIRKVALALDGTAFTSRCTEPFMRVLASSNPLCRLYFLADHPLHLRSKCKYSEIVWLPESRNSPTCANANRLTGLPNTYEQIPMAQKIQTLFIDDIDGGEAEGTVRFALDGAEYEIDLSTQHNEELRAALANYVAHARKVGGTARRTAGRGVRKPSVIDNVAVRNWARENGYDIKERGRVPADLTAKYREATGQ
jgi:Lsr2